MGSAARQGARRRMDPAVRAAHPRRALLVIAALLVILPVVMKRRALSRGEPL